ncbi:MAG: hypothetical protein OIF38_05565, partial [Cellvibrionaceae bacterium]|nr:hypothetical protein [Cellvibrionaceae bacterium]
QSPDKLLFLSTFYIQSQSLSRLTRLFGSSANIPHPCCYTNTAPSPLIPPNVPSNILVSLAPFFTPQP